MSFTVGAEKPAVIIERASLEQRHGFDPGIGKRCGVARPVSRSVLMIVQVMFGFLVFPLPISTSLHAASLSLEWDPSPSPEVAGYCLNVSFPNGSSPVSYDVGNVTQGRLDDLIPGNTYHIYATAYDTNRAQSGPSNLLIYSVPQDGAGTFIQSDTVTHGTWKGVYGNEGYWLVGAPASLPAYATVTTTAPQWTWTSQATSPSALALPLSSGRVAACWYSSTQIGFDFSFADGKVHRVSLYFLDPTSSGRLQRVELVNRDTGAIVDLKTVTSFSNGIYLTWDLTGNVSIRLTPITVNAVVSALFFDKVPTSAQFIKADTATRGNWKGVYGLQGFWIAAVPASLPAYARVKTSAPQWTWVAHSTSFSALMYPDASADRIAACWYSCAPAVFDLSLTASQNHCVSVYFLDASSSGRYERVDLINSDTGVVLDSRTVRSFSAGAYLTRQITGNVSIEITPLNINAVASGIFFD